jgi:small subunit ribosomal protein S6
MSENKMELYEGMYILSATLSDDARTKALERITAEIVHHGGSIEKTFEMGRKRLAYEINKRREGYYYLLYFRAPASFIGEHWKNCKLNEDLIRFMTLRTEEVLESLEFKPLVQI